MLDSFSLEVISRFKEALSAQKLDTDRNSKTLNEENESLPVYNRGLKLSKTIQPSFNTLRSKVTEYGGKKYSVLSNESIEIDNLHNKRKWNEIYGDNKQDQNEDDEDDEEDDELEYDEDKEEHPLKKSRIIELLSPLNHPSEIISHPAISKTYKSQTLSKLAMLNGEDWFYLLEENLGLKDYDHGLDEDKKKKIEEKENNNKDNTVVEDEFEDEEENKADPFFALPTALKRYETYQQNLESSDPLKEELINYLQVSIQRQHEYIKNLLSLRNGLVRADRLKSDLYKWGKEMYEKKSS
ncbi:RXT2-like, N-terminal family protein [Candida albicans]|uniref:RXT2-like, N-terminal family protein n=1 Tax=Candida albicans TaxID=5476 RepID=A0A8H6F465_CANAX|nr:RXT2-like, N-terminal family protein [Candida albicans]